IDREILSWFDQEGRRYLSAEELAQQAQLEAQQAQLEAQQAQLEAQKERQARLAAIAQLDNMGLTVQQISVALGLSVEVVRQRLEES
ncbi:MAG: Uma2 family endonuclease, partial [Limnospira sp. PMC 894.15]|nr:Uma2 family endonuclease [Limnospira sp. PMC 894.15]